MFETAEMRTSFVNAIVSWIQISYEIVDTDQLENIRSSLSALSDEKLIEAGTEVENFEKESKNTMNRIERQVISVEHTLDEDIERLNVPLPLFL